MQMIEEPEPLDDLLMEKVTELKRLIKPGVPCPKPHKSRAARAEFTNHRKGQFKMIAK
jgi:hypothetical protein